ncbi:hypothetical protein [Celeribacter sp.]
MAIFDIEKDDLLRLSDERLEARLAEAMNLINAESGCLTSAPMGPI